MLVLDAWGCHQNEVVEKKWTQKQFDLDSVLVPGTMTSQRQVLDASRKSFKSHLKKPNPLSGDAVEL